MNTQFPFVAFINTYADAPYHAPYKTKDAKERLKYEKIFSDSREALDSFADFVYQLGSDYDMIGFRHQGFLHGSNIKVRDYMWGELRDKSSISIPESISIFIEKHDGDSYPTLRISLEVDEKRAPSGTIRIHNDTLVNSSLPKGFNYYLNQTSTKKIYSTDSQAEAKSLINKGTYKKVQIGRIIDIRSLSNTEITNQARTAIKELVPLYNNLIKETK